MHGGLAMEEEVKHKCCAAFEAAKQEGTDSEGWRSMLWSEDGKILIGPDEPRLDPLRFCPWCGTKISE